MAQRASLFDGKAVRLGISRAMGGLVRLDQGCVEAPRAPKILTFLYRTFTIARLLASYRYFVEHGRELCSNGRGGALRYD